MPSDDANDPLANRRILVIDDNANIHADYRKILVPAAVSADLAELEADLFGAPAKTLQRPAFSVDAALQGQEGHERVLDALRSGQPYALAFVDMRMPPGWDGMETALRVLADDPDIQIVICTAYADYSWDEMAQKLGATDRVLILKKPFDTIEVIQIAQALCRKWTLGRQAKQRVASLEALVQERVHELAASNARLSALIQVSPVGIVVLERDGRVASWNPAAERIFGWSGAEVVGRPLPAGMPDHLRVLMRAGEEAPTGDRQGTDVHVKRKDGVGVEVATFSAALRSPAGDPDGWIVVVADITARKQIEDELRRAKIAAEAAATAKSEFLATMSHEIRTPMNGVMGMAELLLTTRLDAEQLDFANIIHTSGEALLAIINDILDFSKVDAGMLSLEPIPFDLQTTVSGVVELLAARADARGVELFYRFAPDLGSAVIGDAGRVRQILTNLVGNAVKFTLKGHVFVDVRRGDQGGVAIAVHDTGIGIPRDKLRLLFQKFTQADSSTTRRFGGTGLGLAISKQLAELMQGGIEVTSEPGVGSVFTVTLPLPADPAPPRTQPVPANLTGLQVVVADANALSSRILTEQLRSWGCAPLPVAGAGEMVPVLRAAAGTRAIALIDSRLADADALALGAAIRATPGLEGVPLVLLATVGQRGDSKKAAAAGYNAYLTKPVQLLDLRDALAVLCQNGQRAGCELVTRHSLAEARGSGSSGSRRRIAVMPSVAAGQTGPAVLVVEDDPVSSLLIARILERLGCQVSSAATGSAATALAASHDFALIFMDYHLPDLDGVAATRLIRSRTGGARMRIVGMSASVLDQDRELFRAAGMDALITKPVTVEAIRTEVALAVAAGPPDAATRR